MKLLRNPYVVGALALLALFMVFRNVVWPFLPKARRGTVSAPPQSRTETASPKKNEMAAGNGSVAVRPTVVPKESPTGLMIDLERLDAYLRGAPRRDPFRSWIELTDVSTNVPLSLAAIWNQTGSRLAVINNRVLAEGDVLEGLTIEKIEPGLVWLDGPTGRRALEFEPVVPPLTNMVTGKAEVPAASP